MQLMSMSSKNGTKRRGTGPRKKWPVESTIPFAYRCQCLTCFVMLRRVAEWMDVHAGAIRTQCLRGLFGPCRPCASDLSVRAWWHLYYANLCNEIWRDSNRSEHATHISTDPTSIGSKEARFAEAAHHIWRFCGHGLPLLCSSSEGFRYWGVTLR